MFCYPKALLIFMFFLVICISPTCCSAALGTFCVPVGGLAELRISDSVIELLVGSRNASCLFRNAGTCLCLHPAQTPGRHLIGLNTSVGFQVHPFQKTSETLITGLVLLRWDLGGIFSTPEYQAVPWLKTEEALVTPASVCHVG